MTRKGQYCYDKCIATLIECAMACNGDSMCISQCNREENHCVKDCPCYDNCVNGCDGCGNAICSQCEEPEVRGPSAVDRQRTTLMFFLEK